MSQLGSNSGFDEIYVRYEGALIFLREIRSGCCLDVKGCILDRQGLIIVRVVV